MMYTKYNVSPCIGDKNHAKRVYYKFVVKWPWQKSLYFTFNETYIFEYPVCSKPSHNYEHFLYRILSGITSDMLDSNIVPLVKL